MKILLCVIKTNPYFFAPPLGLANIASYLLKHGHRVKIVDDFSFLDLKARLLKEYLRSFSPDIVGFTTHTFTINSCFSLASLIKEINPRIKVVLGGPHATYLSLETLSNKHVDIVVTGEGEETMAGLVTALENSVSLRGIKGLVYKEPNGSIIDNGPRDLIQDLDSMPFPAYDLLDMDKYYASVVFKCSHAKQFGSIITSRGCPYQCTFCSHKMFGKKVRMRSAENVVQELELLRHKHKTREILIMDDAFMVDKERVVRVCNLILERGLDIFWGCNSRADQASAETYAIMRKAGCRMIFIGAESGCQDLLNTMKKGATIAQIENAVKLAKKHIGQVICGFIFGMPGDTFAKAKETIRFSKKLNPDYALFNIAIPLPGSEIFQNAIESCKLNKNDASWRKFNLFPAEPPDIELSSIRKKRLIALTKKSFLEFYLRPKYIWGRLAKIKSIEDIIQYFRGLEIFMRTILH